MIIDIICVLTFKATFAQAIHASKNTQGLKFPTAWKCDDGKSFALYDEKLWMDDVRKIKIDRDERGVIKNLRVLLKGPNKWKKEFSPKKN